MWRQIHARRFAAALTATATAVAGWNASTSATCVDDKSLTPSELTAYLKRHLASFRQAFAKTHPNIATQPIQISHQNNVVRIAFLAPSSSPSILHRFVKELGKPIEVSPSTSDESLQYIFTDATGSFQWLSTKSQGNLFVLFKDLPIYQREVDAVLAAYTHAYESLPVAKSTASSPKAAIATLQQLGLDVYDDTTSGELSWDALAGYDDVKTEIEDTVVLALQNPDIYENIAKHTRHRFESNRPRAILFEGPPGTGKTLSARIIAAQAKVPLIHLPIESVVSKWYGESEQKLSKIFDACDQLEDGAILFIDEIDALASDRSSGQMHEATRRLLSVLLQKVEGFASAKKVTLIAATNRKQDLDSALLSRFNLTIRYELPDLATRQAVFQRYAKQLKENELKELAAQTTNWSCRDIKELCEYTERKWASQVLRKKLHQPVPTLDAYASAIQHQTEQRSNTSVHI